MAAHVVIEPVAPLLDDSLGVLEPAELRVAEPLLVSCAMSAAVPSVRGVSPYFCYTFTASFKSPTSPFCGGSVPGAVRRTGRCIRPPH